MKIRKKRWTEKQIREKIKDLNYRINRTKDNIKHLVEELEDLEILKQAYQEKLAKEYHNPSSKNFGQSA